ncbi:hypothetical protein K8R62_02735 [bacterium]|nr:hypothetical protein [bacterium]
MNIIETNNQPSIIDYGPPNPNELLFYNIKLIMLVLSIIPLFLLIFGIAKLISSIIHKNKAQKKKSIKMIMLGLILFIIIFIIIFINKYLLLR